MTIAKIKFSQLPAADDTDIADGDIIPVVNGITSKKITFGNFREYLVSRGFASVNDIDTKVEDAITSVVGGAPEYLDTLKELADAINNDAGFAVTVQNLVSQVFEGKTSDDLPEGETNKYFTSGAADFHFDTRFSEKTTTQLDEGSNLYFTEQRVLDVVNPLIPTSIFDLGVPDVGTPENIPGYLYYDGTELSWLGAVGFSGDYNDLINKPTIPAPYTLPTASTSTIGGVRVDGTTITINGSGVISAVGGGGSVGPNPTFTSVTATTLNVRDVNFTGTGAVNITSGSDINLQADGWITFSSLPKIPTYTLAQLEALVGVPFGAIAVCSNPTIGSARPVWFNGSTWKDMLNGDLSGPDDFSVPNQ